ncbi:MAG: nucleotidyltransferase domain-containing protein [Candidatus Schekmanbacteria bacterium]|nr:nucleotidyltransferase domain-containing protein [Candidatus Schekmanbacteria bacterium]
MSKVKTNIIKLLKEYITEVNKICPVEKAVLFGSYAKGLNNKDSDIDVAIFSKKVNEKNRLEIMSKLIMLINKFKVDIQPVVFPYRDYLNDDNDFISGEIKKRGMEIKI